MHVSAAAKHILAQAGPRMTTSMLDKKFFFFFLIEIQNSYDLNIDLHWDLADVPETHA